jgi:hypothetical protein
MTSTPRLLIVQCDDGLGHGCTHHSQIWVPEGWLMVKWHTPHEDPDG